MTIRVWPAQEAEARFTELLETCLRDGPQLITQGVRRGGGSRSDRGMAAACERSKANAQAIASHRLGTSGPSDPAARQMAPSSSASRRVKGRRNVLASRANCTRGIP